MSIDLKKFPFCGSKAVSYDEGETRFLRVRCSNEETCPLYQGFEVESWNTRHESANSSERGERGAENGTAAPKCGAVRTSDNSESMGYGESVGAAVGTEQPVQETGFRIVKKGKWLTFCLDDSFINCQCIGEPFISRIVDAFNANAAKQESEQSDKQPRTRDFYPQAVKSYNKWIKTAGDNPIIMADVSFETYLAGWQANEKSPKREIVEREPIEFRKDDEGELDEIVGDCTIHLERMSGNCWWLGVYRPGSNERAAITLHTKGAVIKASIGEEMPEDQSRRG